MQAKARDDQALVKTLPSSRVGAQDIHLSKKVDNRFWNDKEPLVARQLSPLGGIETLSTSRPQKPCFGRILSFPIYLIFLLGPFPSHILKHSI